MNNKIIYPRKLVKSITKENISQEKLEDFIFGGKTLTPVEPTVPEKRLLEPAWIDEDDCEEINMNTKRKRYYCSTNEETVSTDEYRSRLRSEFLKIHGNADWANVDDKSERENDFLRDFYDFGQDHPHNLKEFSADVLHYHKCSDANKNYGKGTITALQFHPRSRLFLVGSMEKSIKFFGYNQEEEINFISSVSTNKFPIKRARFVGNDTVVATARASSFMCYDLQADKTLFVPPSKVVTGTLRDFSESPDSRLLAFHSSTRGQIHLFDFRSKEFVRTYTKNGSIMSSHFMGDDKILLHGDDGLVWVWDVKMHKCCHKFVDHGCIEGTTLSVSPNLEYILCGSNSGVVNLYGKSECLSDLNPIPLRSFPNLVTSCTHTTFDSSSSMFGMLSIHKSNAMRLAHVGGRSVFNNFPMNGLGVPSVADFSPSTGLLGVGCANGLVNMFRLESFYL